MARPYEKSNAKVFAIPGGSAGTHDGDVTFLGTTTTTTAGRIYTPLIVSGSSPIWVSADQDVAGRHDGLLAVALGTSSTQDGMLLRGVVTIGQTLSGIGDPVYLGDGGLFTMEAPTGLGDNARVIGFLIAESQVYFNPDNSVDARKVKQISTSDHSFYMNSSSTTSDFFVPFNNLNESSNPTIYYTRTLAPYGGRLLKAIVRSSANIGSACKLQFHKITNTAVGFGSTPTEEVTGIDLSVAQTSQTADFSVATFSEGDVIGVSMIKSSTGVANVNVTLVWEYII